MIQSIYLQMFITTQILIKIREKQSLVQHFQ
jgi:hypothetical protein